MYMYNICEALMVKLNMYVAIEACAGVVIPELASCTLDPCVSTSLKRAEA